MKTIILAAGYATRLYPLTRDFPKPLLDVGGRTLLDRLCDRIRDAEPRGEIHIVTNARFFNRFKEWTAMRQDPRIEVWNDGTTSPQDRLGAIGDLLWMLDRLTGVDALLATAADNLYEFDLKGFIEAFRAAPGAWITVHHVTDPERRRRTGIAVLDAEGRVVEFHEKPSDPPSEWGVPPLYLFDAATVPLIRHYGRSGLPLDSPGHLVAWLCRRTIVRAWPIRGVVHDIGTPEALEACRARYRGEEAGDH